MNIIYIYVIKLLHFWVIQHCNLHFSYISIFSTSNSSFSFKIYQKQ